jgi:hypothetical protein
MVPVEFGRRALLRENCASGGAEGRRGKRSRELREFRVKLPESH